MSTKVMTRQNEKNRNKIRTMAKNGNLNAKRTRLNLLENKPNDVADFISTPMEF